MRTIGIVMFFLFVAGCASREIKVDCEGKLQPINAPSAKAAP